MGQITRAFTLALLVVSGAAHAKQTIPSNGMLEIRPGHSLYVEHLPARNGKPTLFLANGLTYTTQDWKTFVDALRALDPDIGFVLYDMTGMGETALNSGGANEAIPFDNQTRDLHDLKSTLAIYGPAVALGLSYGGAEVLNHAAKYPNDFDTYIAMAPFLERMPEQDSLIKLWCAQHRVLYPWDKRTDDELYDWYLWVMVSTTYPVMETILPYQLVPLYRMVQGAKNWDAFKVGPALPKGKVHVIASLRDEYVKFERMKLFLSKVAPGVLASVMVINDPESQVLSPFEKHHKINQLRPVLSAAMVYQILIGNPELQKGLTFSVDPKKGVARSGKIEIPLETDCATLLRKAS
jgi:pimeloyl-ACP methyl ester carboxylesterase